MKTKCLGRTAWTSDKYALVRFDHARRRYNLLFHEIENELLPLCRYYGMGVIPYDLMGSSPASVNLHGAQSRYAVRLVWPGRSD